MLIAVARDLGAADFGGPLTRAEGRLLKAADRVKKRSDRAVLSLQTAIRNGDDPLGKALCSLRTPLTRRHTGTFYTPEPIVEHMLDWTIDCNPTRFIDAGCGSGRFVRNILARRLRASIIAIDVDPMATLMTRAVFASFKYKKAIAKNVDYTQFSLGRDFGRSAYVSNPPYVRHHDLEPATKAWASRTAKQLGHRISGLAGLHTLFMLATAKLAKKGDVGAFITSAEWMDTNYGSIVRDLMLNGLGGKNVHAFVPQAAPFSDAMTTAAITYFEIGSEPLKLTFSVSQTPAAPQQSQFRRDIPASVLAKSARWSPMLREPSCDPVSCKHLSRSKGSPQSNAAETTFSPGFQSLRSGCPMCKATSTQLTLRSIARVHRGQATGANSFFVLSREKARNNGIEAYCRPVISRAEQILSSGGVLRDNPLLSVLLDVPPDMRLENHPALAEYLRHGQYSHDGDISVDKRWIPSHRRSWFSVAAPNPPIVATYMARQAPFFALNPDGLALINVGHGIYPTIDMTDEDLAILVAALNADRQQFVGKGRTYHGGLEKFEPKEMENLPLPMVIAQSISVRLDKPTLSATRRRRRPS